jgi:hypothetical protein
MIRLYQIEFIFIILLLVSKVNQILKQKEESHEVFVALLEGLSAVLITDNLEHGNRKRRNHRSGSRRRDDSLDSVVQTSWPTGPNVPLWTSAV